jgi:hypothetical protein
MKKILFAGLLLLLAVSLLGITSCSKSTTTSATAAPMSTLNPSTSEPQTSVTTPPSTINPVTSSASTGIDWSTVPTYPGSVQTVDRDDTATIHYLTPTDNSTASTELNWYNTELPQNGWTVTGFYNNLQEITATNTAGYNLIVTVIGPGGSSGSEIDITAQ